MAKREIFLRLHRDYNGVDLLQNKQAGAGDVITVTSNERDGASNHRLRDCLPNRLFKRRSKKTPKLRVTGLCVWDSPVTDEFPAQRASNAENVTVWWRHHGNLMLLAWQSSVCIHTIWY